VRFFAGVLALVAAFAPRLLAHNHTENMTTTSWSLIRSPHFEIYSQSGATSARAALLWFEQLRAFFNQLGVQAEQHAPLRVIGFRSTAEYETYRLRPTADAYYVGTETRDYIVMPAFTASEFPIAAHEYAHALLHRDGLRLPLWFEEGLAEYLSTVRIREQHSQLGGVNPAHLETLQRNAWIPLPQLLAAAHESATRQDRHQTALFYAESWALVDMLLNVPEYRPHVADLVTSIASSVPSDTALVSIYHQPLDRIAASLRNWVAAPQSTSIDLPGIRIDDFEANTSELSPSDTQAILADLLLAAGALERSENIFRDLARDSPGDPTFDAALGTIAFRRGDTASARRYWKNAIDHGVTDALLCFHYALLAEDANLPAEEIRSALERAIALQPDFDDARYKLALLESIAGEYETAVSQLRAMKHVAPARAYTYWCAMSSALSELGKREEAAQAAKEAARRASTPDERTNAAQLLYIAQTDLTVRFTRDPAGNLQLVTTRVPHGSVDWNPFIEPGDHIRRAEGRLTAVTCGHNRITAMSVDTATGPLLLAIPDPLHVLMKNAPAEFNCGPQTPSPVAVEYAAPDSPAHTAGVLRGMEFR